eukprot:COSAG05_NODE_106_length_18750_cov_677.083105_6_plen_70_part_00
MQMSTRCSEHGFRARIKCICKSQSRMVYHGRFIPRAHPDSGSDHGVPVNGRRQVHWYLLLVTAKTTVSQ